MLGLVQAKSHPWGVACHSSLAEEEGVCNPSLSVVCQTFVRNDYLVQFATGSEDRYF